MGSGSWTNADHSQKPASGLPKQVVHDTRPIVDQNGLRSTVVHDGPRS
jgi:hypothetical protein